MAQGPDPTPREKLISLHNRAAKGELCAVLSRMALPEETHDLIDYILDVHCVSMLWLADREEFNFQELPSGREVLRYASSLGAEAKANGRRNMNGDDREDIALKAGYDKWTDIPIGMRDEASTAFYTGWRNE